jgi:hypothetical protein
MDKFNWDLIMQDKTCVKVKNEKQYRKISEEADIKGYLLSSGDRHKDRSFNHYKIYKENYINFSKGTHATLSYYKKENYTILKYKDVRVRKANIVCEKENFKSWLLKYINNEQNYISSYSTIEKDSIGFEIHKFFFNDKEYKDYLIEKIIIKCIEYYNNKYPEKTKQLTLAWLLTEKKISWFRIPNYYLTIKKSLELNNDLVYNEVKKELENFNGKNLLKYYFTGEF